MPNTSSAKKALRVSARKRVVNLRKKNILKNTVKDLKKKVISGNKKEAQEALPAVYKAIDKATKGGIIKKNNASRKKSRLTQLVKKLP